MFMNLELFPQEKQVYNQGLAEINNAAISPEEKQKRISEAQEKFKAEVRKYLPAALDVIKNTFSCQYSIYKVGRDVDANFKVVETNIRKSRSEMLAEMEQFKTQAASMSLTNEQITKVNLAMDVLLTYSDDANDESNELRQSFLDNSKVVASSIIETPSRDNNAFTPAPAEQTTNFNPYANQPIVLDNGFHNEEAATKTITDPFASLYGDTNTSPKTGNTYITEPIDEIPETASGNALGVVSTAAVAGIATQMVQPPVMNGNFNASMQPQGFGIQTQTMGNSYNGNMGMNSMNTNYGMGGMQPQAMPMNYNAYGNNTMMPYNNMQTPYSQNPPVNNYNNMASANVPNPYVGNMPMMNGNSGMQPQAMPMNPGMGMQAPSMPISEDAQRGKIDQERSTSVFIGAKLMTGLLRMPLAIISSTLMSLVVVIILDKTGLMIKLTESFGNFFQWIIVAMILVMSFISSSSILGPISSRTKNVSKFMASPLCLFTGIIFLLVHFIPQLMEKLAEKMSGDIFLYVSLAFVLFIIYAFIVGSFTLLGSFFSSEAGGRLKTNILDAIGLLWSFYALVGPTVIVALSYFGVEDIVSKISVLYSYDHAIWIMIAVSFILPIPMLAINKIEERKIRRSL